MIKTDGELLYDALVACGVIGISDYDRHDEITDVEDRFDVGEVAAKFRRLVIERDRLKEIRIKSELDND